MGYARRAYVDLVYNGVSVSGPVGGYLESFSYTDGADGTSDRISIQVNDRDGRWVGAWMPSKGDVLTPTIRTQHWDPDRSLPCGRHIIDSFSASGGMGGGTASIEAVSMPADEAFKATERTKTWEKTTLAQIGAEIAGRAGVAFMYEAPSVYIESREQNGQADSDFYASLCTTYGYILKTYNSRLVVFDPARYEQRAAVCTITPQDVETWSYRTVLDGTYTGAKISYTNPLDGETVDVTIGGGSRILSLNDKADSIADAQLIAKGKLAAENRKTDTVELSKELDLRLASGSCIMLSGFGRFDGKYMVQSITHNLQPGGGSTSSISAYLIH